MVLDLFPRKLQASLVVALLLVPMFAAACESRNELEAVYCQLKHDYAQLPSLEDFRRNSPTVQRLLLKRPARDAGIELPPSISKKTKTLSRSSAAGDPTEYRRTSPDIVSTPANRVKKKPIDNQNCHLSDNRILCGSDIYFLMLNRANHKLVKGSLNDANELSFPARSNITTARYWSDSYQHYIEKMLSIGLGASTMSYTKFVYTWQTAQKQGQNPQSRFSQMFEYLKRDKRALSVKASYDNLMPEAISWCQSLSRMLWVCDNGERNWVYQRSRNH